MTTTAFVPFSGSPFFRLSDEQLLFFRRPRGWREIVTQKPFREEDWWREAVMDADEAGRSLLRWHKSTKRWALSARGRVRLGLPEKEETDAVRSSQELHAG